MKLSVYVIIGLFISASLFGYVIYLKDGSTRIAKEKYTVKGDMALITLENGTVISIKLNLIDIEKTEKYNKAGITGAVVLDSGTGTTSTSSSSKKKVTLSDLARKRRHEKANIVFDLEPRKDTPRVPKGEKKKQPFPDESVTQAFTRLFENSSLFQYKMFQGETPKSLRIEMTTDNEKEIFSTLSLVGRILPYLQDQGKPIDKVELFMATSVGQPAGRFIITREEADLIKNKKIPIETFYVQYVLF